MWARTNPMKMMPLTAIRSFNAMVERVDLLFFTRVAVATRVTVALRVASAAPRGCDMCPCISIRARPLRFPVPSGESVLQHSQRDCPDGGDDGVDGRRRTRAHPGSHRGADPARRPLVALS